MKAVKSANTPDFDYQPPKAAYGAQKILVKPNLGYPVKPPVTVSMGVLKKVLMGLRKASPDAKIIVVEGVCSSISLPEIASRNGLFEILDRGMELLDADELALEDYPNLSPNPVRFKSMLAPAILKQVDCRISVGALKRTHLKGEPLISAALKNLYGLFPRARYKARSANSRGQLHRPSVPLVLQDIYFSIGHLFDGAVVDGDLKFISPDWKPDRGKSVKLGKVFWGEDLISVDREACSIANEPLPTYLNAIDNLRASL